MGFYDTRITRSDRNRRGKIETYRYGGNNLLLKAIEQRGEAVPGDLAQELGLSRSTLAHKLGKLQAQKKIVRMGGGRSIRYRIATSEDFAPKAPAPEPAANPPKGLWPSGLKNLFEKIMKG